MTTGKSSPEHIVSCLTDLRRIFGTGAKATPEHLTWQNSLYIEALADIPAAVLTAATRQIIREADRWPTPSAIRKVARDIAESAAAARTLANPEPEDLGATQRNEAIALLGHFAPVANAITGSPSQRYAEFIAEAGRLWGKARPAGGLAEIDKQRLRGVYGFALEAWARVYLGAEPLNVAYASSKVRDAHRLMTSREIVTSDGGTLMRGGLADTLDGVVSRAAE